MPTKIHSYLHAHTHPHTHPHTHALSFQNARLKLCHKSSQASPAGDASALSVHPWLAFAPAAPYLSGIQCLPVSSLAGGWLGASSEQWLTQTREQVDLF